MKVQSKAKQKSARAYLLKTDVVVPITGVGNGFETYKKGNYCVHEGTERKQLTPKEFEEQYTWVDEV